MNQIACARAANYEKLIHSRVYITNWWPSSLWWRHDEAFGVGRLKAVREKKDSSLQQFCVMTRSRSKILKKNKLTAPGLVTRPNPTYVGSYATVWTINPLLHLQLIILRLSDASRSRFMARRNWNWNSRQKAKEDDWRSSRWSVAGRKTCVDFTSA